MIYFYENLGILFYTIATADAILEEIEFRILKKTIKDKCAEIDTVADAFHSDAVHHRNCF